MMLSFVDSSATTICDTSVMFDFPKPAAKPLSLHYHIVFHLDKDCSIDEHWRKLFYKYIAGCLQALGGDLEAIGGAGDHVHLLINLNSNDTLADVARRFKLLTRSWVKRKIPARDFAWQEDFQAFTVSLSQRGRVKRYILNQKEHHRRHGSAEDYPSSWGCVPQGGVAA